MIIEKSTVAWEERKKDEIHGEKYLKEESAKAKKLGELERR